MQAALGQDNGVVQGEGPGVPTFVHVLGAGGPNPPVARETFHILLGSAELGDPTRRCVLPSKPSMPPTGVRVRLLEEVAAAAAVHHALATKKIWVHLDRALVLHPQSVAAVHVDGVELVADTRELCSDSSVLVLPDRLSEPALRREIGRAHV